MKPNKIRHLFIGRREAFEAQLFAAAAVKDAIRMRLVNVNGRTYARSGLAPRLRLSDAEVYARCLYAGACAP